MERAGERGCWGGVKAGEWEEVGRLRVGSAVEWRASRTGGVVVAGTTAFRAGSG